MEKLITLLEHISSIAEDVDDRHIKDSAQFLIEKLRKQHLNLVVLGQFKRGKTTVINALLEEKILPSAVIPLTSIITKVTYNETKDAEVVFFNGSKKTISLDEINNYVTEKHNSNNVKGVDFVEVNYPSAYLRHGIVLIDTPGIGSTFEHNTTVAYNFLPSMDAGIFVISVDPPLSEAEYKYLDSIKTHIDKIFFLLNKIDMMSEQECEESLNFTKALIEKKLSVKNVKIFPVSAKLALESKLLNNKAMYEKSGFELFESTLDHFIRKDKLGTLLASANNKASILSNELIMNIQLTISAVNSPIDELKNKIAVLHSEVDIIEKKHKEMELLLEGEIKSLKEGIEISLNKLKQQTSAKLKQDIYNLSVNKKNKKELVNILTKQLKNGIETAFSSWFKTEEQNISNSISRILMKYAKSVDDEINNVKQAAANLFNIQIMRYNDITTLDPYSRLWYKVDDIITWGIDNFSFILPKLFFKNYILKQTENRIDEELDRNAGRARYDLFRRIDNTKERFVDELLFRKTTVINGIFKAVTKAEELKTINEPDAQARLKILNSYIEQIKRITVSELVST